MHFRDSRFAAHEGAVDWLSLPHERKAASVRPGKRAGLEGSNLVAGHLSVFLTRTPSGRRDGNARLRRVPLSRPGRSGSEVHAQNNCMTSPVPGDLGIILDATVWGTLGVGRGAQRPCGGRGQEEEPPLSGTSGPLDTSLRQSLRQPSITELRANEESFRFAACGLETVRNQEPPAAAFPPSFGRAPLPGIGTDLENRRTPPRSFFGPPRQSGG